MTKPDDPISPISHDDDYFNTGINIREYFACRIFCSLIIAGGGVALKTPKTVISDALNLTDELIRQLAAREKFKECQAGE